MIFVPTPIEGVSIVEIEPHPDERGFFARTWCTEELRNCGLVGEVSQISISYSLKKGTLRGMHFQRKPHEEVKVVRVTRGAVFDVTLDLRPDSATYTKWFGLELNAANRKMLYVPRGVAHGFVTLEDDVEFLYIISHPHAPEAVDGVRWDDPAFSIEWPIQPVVISERDRTFPDFLL